VTMISRGMEILITGSVAQIVRVLSLCSLFFLVDIMRYLF